MPQMDRCRNSAYKTVLDGMECGGRSRFYNSGNTGKRIQKQDEVVGGKGKEFKQNCSEENKNNLQIKGTLNKQILCRGTKDIRKAKGRWRGVYACLHPRYPSPKLRT